MSFLLSFMIRQEDKERGIESDEQFKAQVFAADPERYFKIWGTDDEEAPIDEEDIVEEVPESPDDFQALMREMARQGVIDVG